MTVNAGGEIRLLNSTTLNLQGALLVNNGTVTGTTNVFFGSVAKGSGTYGTINVLDGGAYSPGNSPGTTTNANTSWSSGGKYVWEINKLDDGLGSLEQGSDPGWDLWNAGILGISSNFEIELQSLTLANANGELNGWNPSLDQQWLIATSTNTAFSPAVLAQLNSSLDVSLFESYNNLAGGEFELISTGGGNNLVLQFTAIPEPSTFVMGGLSLLGLGWLRLRRIRR